MRVIVNIEYIPIENYNKTVWILDSSLVHCL